MATIGDHCYLAILLPLTESFQIDEPACGVVARADPQSIDAPPDAPAEAIGNRYSVPADEQPGAAADRPFGGGAGPRVTSACGLLRAVRVLPPIWITIVAVAVVRITAAARSKPAQIFTVAGEHIAITPAYPIGVRKMFQTLNCLV